MYSAKGGESLATVSARTGASQTDILSANPGITFPLRIGEVVNVPTQPKQVATSVPDKGAVVLIDGARFRHWTSITFSTGIDSVGVFHLSAPFKSHDAEFRETFTPFTYKKVQVVVDGEVLFTGTIINVEPVSKATGIIVEVSGYALPGVLEDCTPPISMASLEFDGMGINQIAATLAKPFGIGVEFAPNPGAAFGATGGIDTMFSGSFSRVACGVGQTVFSFLKGLAQQRGLVLTNTVDGKLAIQTSVGVGKPIAELSDKTLGIEVVANFSGQQYFSSISATEPQMFGFESTTVTRKNPKLGSVLRPLTIPANDSNGGGAVAAVEARMGRMFANSIGYDVRVPYIKSPTDGKLWHPNKTVKVHAPSAMVYNPYEFAIREVRINITQFRQDATLRLMLPGGFSSKIPEALPWD